MIDRTGPLIHRGINPSARNVLDLLRSELATMDFDPPYQRGDVWTTEQRVNLVRSMLLGVPVAAIVLNRRVDNEAWAAAEGDPDPAHWFAVIDGKQRLTTFRMWFSGGLAVPGAWFDDEYFDGERPEWVTYPELSGRGRTLLARAWTVPVAEVRLGSLAEEAEVYGLLNSGGTAHTGADLERARVVAAGLVAAADSGLTQRHWVRPTSDPYWAVRSLCGRIALNRQAVDRMIGETDRNAVRIEDLPACEECAARLEAEVDG